MNKPPVKVLIANDSAVERDVIFHALASDPGIAVISMVNDGRQAVEAACRQRPDVIAMDLHMPNLDGLEATRRIMERCPVPIVIVSASTSGRLAPNGTRTFHALEFGALALVRTPPGLNDPAYPTAVKELVDTLKLMAEVKVVGRRYSQKRKAAEPAATALPAASYELVAIGASAGGPLVLREILSRLPKDFPVPILIVQHMAEGFIEAFSRWLRESTGLPVRVAADGDALAPGSVYVAPSGMHLGVGSGKVQLSHAEPEDGLRPAVSHLFRSVRKAYGQHAIAVLLSGMGRDGAEELLALKRVGAVTIVQDEESALIYGMPGEAVKIGAADHVLPVERIAQTLASFAKRTTQP